MADPTPPVNGNTPSWMTSTLSQLAIGSAVSFVLVGIICAIGMIWFKLQAETAKEIMGPFEYLIGTFGGAYLATRKAGT